MQRHWSINGRFLSQPITGVQRYCEMIVRELDELVAEDHAAVMGLTFDVVVPSSPRREITLRKIPIREVRGLSGHAWEQAVLPFNLPGGLLSLGNTAPLLARRQIVCMHDVNVWLCPASYSRSFRALYKTLLPVLGRTAGAITTVSKHSASQLKHFGITPSAHSIVIANGHEHARAWKPSLSDSVSSIAGPSTIVLLGSPAPHKNAATILALADELAARKLKLAIIGTRDRRVFGTAAPDIDAPNIHWLGRVSDDELAALLMSCLCLVFPSHTEGFGLPVVEAMALGCPVILSNSSCLPEIGGDAALYASPLHRNEWLTAIDTLKSDTALRDSLIAKGQNQVQKFSWRQSAIRYAELMKDMAGR